jgi:hypothetical protein
MLKTKKTVFIALLIVGIVPSLLFTYNKVFSFNTSTYEIGSVSLNTYSTTCFDKDEVIQKLNESSVSKVFIFEKRDIYLSENINNIFCLGNVVEVFENEESTLIFLGSNPKVSQLANLIWLFIGIIYCFLKLRNKHRYLFPSFIIFYTSQQILENKVFNFINFINMLSATLVILLIGLFIFDFDEFQKTKFFTLNKLRVLFQNKIFLKVPYKFYSIFNFILIMTVVSTAYMKKFIFNDSISIYNDVLINIYTSAKMFFYNQTSFEAALNQHTPMLTYIYKHLFYIFEYQDFELAHVFLVALVSLLSSLCLFLISNKLIDNKLISSLLSVFFFIFMLDSNALNRDFGILIYLLIFININSYLKNSKKINLFFIIFFSVFQIYNLESYVLSIIFINLLIIFFSTDKPGTIKFYLITTFSSIILFYASFVINSEWSVLLETNYLFHLFNIDPNFQNSSMFKSLGYSTSSQLNFKHASILLIIFHFIYLSKTKKVKISKLDIILYFWFFMEIISLKIAGPRFWNYGLNIILPVILIYMRLLKIYVIDKKVNIGTIYISVFIFLSLYFNPNINNLINYKNVEASHTYITQNYEHSEKINQLIKIQNEKPQKILTWVHPGDWDWIFNSKHQLPATKYWWWFFMKYHQTDYYIWDKNWNEAKVKIDFLSDLVTEQPEYAIVNIGITKPPLFYTNVIDTFYELIYEDYKFKVYKISQSISFGN